MENQERPLQEKLLTPLEVAQRLSISKSKVYQLLQKGVIPVVRIGRSTRVDPIDLSVFIDRCKTPGSLEHLFGNYGEGV